MIVPTVPATTARRSCTRCSASDRRGMEISDVIIVSSLRRAPLGGRGRDGHFANRDVIRCGGARTRRPLRRTKSSEDFDRPRKPALPQNRYGYAILLIGRSAFHRNSLQRRTSRRRKKDSNARALSAEFCARKNRTKRSR